MNRATGETEKVDFGNVGDVLDINARLLNILVENDYLPVVSSLGADKEGKIFNINADTIAAEIAVDLKAEKPVLLSDSTEFIWMPMMKRQKFPVSRLPGLNI